MTRWSYRKHLVSDRTGRIAKSIREQKVIQKSIRPIQRLTWSSQTSILTRWIPRRYPTFNHSGSTLKSEGLIFYTKGDHRNTLVKFRLRDQRPPTSVRCPFESLDDDSGYNYPSPRRGDSFVTHVKKGLGNCLPRPTAKFRFDVTSFRETFYTDKEPNLGSLSRHPHDRPTIRRESFVGRIRILR